MWACGAAGSALPWHGRGRRFDPDQVHQTIHFKISNLHPEVFHRHSAIWCQLVSIVPPLLWTLRLEAISSCLVDDWFFLAIAEFVVHRVDHLLDALGHHLHVNIHGRGKSFVTQHAWVSLTVPLVWLRVAIHESQGRTSPQGSSIKDVRRCPTSDFSPRVK